MINPKGELFVWGPIDGRPIYISYFMVAIADYFPKKFSYPWPEILGYFIRFMATGFNAVEVGFEKVGSKYLEASRMLGQGMTKTFLKVDLPLIKGSIISGFVLTFVEICKELPLALLLRPFNFETLATKTYQYANDEQIYEASISSLLIIAISILAVAIFQMQGKRVKR